MKKIYLYGAIPFIALICFLAPIKSQAASGGIQISPLTYKYELSPGESESGNITVTNLNDSEINYSIETEDFSGSSDDGAPSFGSSNSDPGVTTLADWFTFSGETEGTLAANQSITIDFTLNIPVGAEPGGHYAAIFAKQVRKNAQGQTELGVASRVGTLVLVSVPGDVKKTGVISEFKYPNYLFQGPVNFSARVSNTGTTHYDSTMAIEITSMFGKKISATFPINAGTKLAENTHTILPKSSRSYTAVWDKKYPFGYYRVTARANDGNGDPITVSGAFWAIPLVIVIPVLAGLILIIWFIFYLKKHVKFVNAPEESSPSNKE